MDFITMKNQTSEQPKVSIVVPVYNVAEYLTECLESLVSQSLKDIEIICVNDGSTDNSLEILEKYALCDNRVKIITQENRGQGHARNAAILVASGEYIGFVDSDDWVCTEYFERLYNASQNVDICLTKSIISVDNSNRNLKEMQWEQKDIKKHLLKKNCHCWNKIYKRDFILNNSIFFHGATNRIEDNYFSVKAIVSAKAINCIDDVSYYWRKNMLSTIHKKLSEKDFIALDILKGIESFGDIDKRYLKTINRKVEREASIFYWKLDESLRKEFADLFKTQFPNLHIIIRKPLEHPFLFLLKRGRII